MNKFSYSLNEENYHGEFDTREQAIEEGSIAASREGCSQFWTAENVPPWQPESIWEASDWLESVSCQDEYSLDCAKDWEQSTREQREELEAEVRKVMADWLDRHDLRPKFWLVENVMKHDVAMVEKH